VSSLAARGSLSPHDENHGLIVKRYEEHFCKVLDLSKVGRACPDVLVRISTRDGHVLQLVEIKTEDGSLSPSQELFHTEWGARSCTVVRTIHDVDAHIARVKAR
jgi:hypothetical protein